MRRSTLTIMLSVMFSMTLFSQAEYLPKKRYTAFPIQKAPVINGVFDEEIWQEGEWAGDFVQHEPYENRPPSQQTEFKVAFDNTNL